MDEKLFQIAHCLDNFLHLKKVLKAAFFLSTYFMASIIKSSFAFQSTFIFILKVSLCGSFILRISWSLTHSIGPALTKSTRFNVVWRRANMAGCVRYSYKHTHTHPCGRPGLQWNGLDTGCLFTVRCRPLWQIGNELNQMYVAFIRAIPFLLAQFPFDSNDCEYWYRPIKIDGFIQSHNIEFMYDGVKKAVISEISSVSFTPYVGQARANDIVDIIFLPISPECNFRVLSFRFLND